MTADTIALLALFALVAVFAWKRSSRRPPAEPHIPYVTPESNRSTAKRPYVLQAKPAIDLVVMPECTDRLFTYKDERLAAKARQRLWIRYQDRAGHITERIVEIYHPENDAVVFAWCCLKREPRTFARNNIQSWKLLPERFEFDPIVDQYWEEEGMLDMSEKIPWRRWLESQPNHIVQRYS
jgi:hypothetical protein